MGKIPYIQNLGWSKVQHLNVQLSNSGVKELIKTYLHIPTPAWVN